MSKKRRERKHKQPKQHNQHKARSESSEGKTTVSHYDYANARGESQRITVRGTRKQQYDADLFAQALLMIAEDIALGRTDDDNGLKS